MARLQPKARDYLRRQIRSHPDVKKHVSRLADIRSLNEEGLIGLAERMGISLSDAIMSGVNAWFSKTHLAGDKVRQARWDHSHEYPAFIASLELDLSLSILGRTVSRKLRLDYKATPAWEYFDLHKGELYKGWEHSSVEALLQGFVAEGSEASAGPKPVWYQAGVILDEGVLPLDMLDDLHEAIDRHCQDRIASVGRSGACPYPNTPPYERCSSGEATLPQQRTEGNH